MGILFDAKNRLQCLGGDLGRTGQGGSCWVLSFGEGNPGANAQKHINHNKKSLIKKKNHSKGEPRERLRFCQAAISLSLLSPIPPFPRTSPSGQLAQRDERRKKGEKKLRS